MKGSPESSPRGNLPLAEPSPTVEETPPVEEEAGIHEDIPAGELEALAGNYEDPGSSHIWEISLDGSKVNVLENYASRFSLQIEKPSERSGVWFHSEKQKLSGSFSRAAGTESGPFAEIQVQHDESRRTFQRFMDLPLQIEALREYEGLYTCHALETSYRVKAAAEGVKLENSNPHIRPAQCGLHPHHPGYVPGAISAPDRLVRGAFPA